MDLGSGKSTRRDGDLVQVRDHGEAHFWTCPYKARHVARGFEEQVDDKGWTNYAATAGVHRFTILQARATASHIGTGAQTWSARIAEWGLETGIEEMGTGVSHPTPTKPMEKMSPGGCVASQISSTYGLQSPV